MASAFLAEFEQTADIAWRNALKDYSSPDWTPKEIGAVSIYNKLTPGFKTKSVMAEVKINTTSKAAIDYIINPN